MNIFVSYSTRDRSVVEALDLDLEAYGHSVWRDADILGGQRWWDEICGEIRSCDVFVFALSPDAIRSRYCLAELEYAVRVDRPLLPVEVAEVNVELAPESLRNCHCVSYVNRNPSEVIHLGRSMSEVTLRTIPSGEISAPAPPLDEISVLRDRITAASLDFDGQRLACDELSRMFRGTEDVSTELVRLLRGRRDVAQSVAMDLDELLSGVRSSGQASDTARIHARAILANAHQRCLTPILGTGITDSLVGTRRSMAQEWAKRFEFPLWAHQMGDLPQVAQFVNVVAGDNALRESLRTYMVKELRQRPGMSAEPSLSLDQLFVEAWTLRDTSRADPHVAMAALPCPIYITAHPVSLLEHALREAGKDPVWDLVRWRRDVESWPISPFESTTEPFVPTVERPLVFHVFGRLDHEESLVVTEDDYFEFLIAVTQDRKLIPDAVRAALADSALLLLGFGVEDWDFRCLWRAMMDQEGKRKRRRYTHIAAQIDINGTVASPTGARKYLETYFSEISNPALKIFWGSTDQLVEALADVSDETT